MGENLKRQLDTRIDQEIGYQLEITDKKDRKKFLDLQKKASDLRKMLKEAVKKPAEDDRITETEWKEMFKSLQDTDKNLLEFFRIWDLDDLKIFLGIREKMSEEGKKELEEALLSGTNSQVLDDFFMKKARLLPDEDVGEIVYSMALTGEIRFDQVLFHLGSFRGSSFVDDIMIRASAQDPEGAIRHYYMYRHHPWAIDVLKEAFRVYDFWGPNNPIDQPSVPKKIKELFNEPEINDRLLEFHFIVAENRRIRKIANKILEDSPEAAKMVDALLADPASQRLDDFDPDWVESPVKSGGHTLDFHEKEKPSLCIAVVRNLYFKDIDVTEENVKQELERIMLTRKQYEDMPVFRGRNVLFVAHSERKPPETVKKYDEGQIRNDDEFRFGKSAVLETVRRQGAKVDLKKADDTLESLEKTKAETLRGIVDTPPPFTFVFDGHGGKSAIYLSNGVAGPVNEGELKDSVKITLEELVEAFTKRYEKFPGLVAPSSPLAANRDILIFSACFNHTFARRFFELLPEDVLKPIVIGASEYGQYAHSNLGTRYGSSFFDNTLGMGNPLGSITTFGEVFWGDVKQGIDNPYIYIPDENPAGLMELSKIETKKPKDVPV